MNATPDLDAAALSHVGRVRTENEDACHADPPSGLFVVADGMGGHAAGEVASRIAVETLTEALADGPGTASPGELAPAIEEANRRIHRDARENPSRSGMGTTVTALIVDDAGWHLGHVGDSRAYLRRDGELLRISKDHSWVQEQVDRGKLSREEARLHPASSMLTRALGTARDVEVDRRDGDLREGDVFLLASDGLTDMLPEDRVEEILAGEDGPEETARRLIHESLEAGGRDNTTAVVIHVRPAGG